MEIQKTKQSSRWIRGEFIGKGSYGAVSLGIRESDGGVFAVKSAAKDSLSSMEALENEIEMLRAISTSCSSNFIVEYYGDDETGSHRNLHVEYLPGGDVAQAGGIADVELIRSYTWCLVMALKDVHSQGIVHCDVKGSNVLINSNTGVAKLADFGSAKKVDNQRSKIVPRGSPLWMAPEVVRGESQGFEADIWSLGCTVIEMFTGLPAWQDRGAHTLYQIGYSDDLPEYPARLPDLGRDFLDKCLARDPARRWSCDRLLEHPFLLPALDTKITEPSPRSILDWQNLDFSDSDDDHETEEEEVQEFDEISTKERIGKLATTTGVNWESDGWVEVRSLNKEVEVLPEEKQDIAEGTSSEYLELLEDQAVITVWEEDHCDNPTWRNSEESSGDRWRGDGSYDTVAEIDDCAVRIEKLGAEVETEITAGLFHDLLFLLFLLYSHDYPTSMGFTNDNDNNKNTSSVNYLWIRFVLFITSMEFPVNFSIFDVHLVSQPTKPTSSTSAENQLSKVSVANWFYFSSNVWYFKSI